MTTSIQDYVCNLIKGKKYIAQVYYALDRTFNIAEPRCVCFKIIIPNIGQKVYKGSQLRKLYDESTCYSYDKLFSEIQNGKPTLDQYVRLLMKARSTIDKLYKESVHAYVLRDQSRLFCYTFNNPFGSYAGVNKNCLGFKGYFNFSRMFCLCEKNWKTFDSLIVFGGLTQ